MRPGEAKADSDSVGACLCLLVPSVRPSVLQGEVQRVGAAGEGCHPAVFAAAEGTAGHPACAAASVAVAAAAGEAAAEAEVAIPMVGSAAEDRSGKEALQAEGDLGQPSWNTWVLVLQNFGLCQRRTAAGLVAGVEDHQVGSACCPD